MSQFPAVELKLSAAIRRRRPYVLHHLDKIVDATDENAMVEISTYV